VRTVSGATFVSLSLHTHPPTHPHPHTHTYTTHAHTRSLVNVRRHVSCDAASRFHDGFGAPSREWWAVSSRDGAQSNIQHCCMFLKIRKHREGVWGGGGAPFGDENGLMEVSVDGVHQGPRPYRTLV
jgi:hypothetical protein